MTLDQPVRLPQCAEKRPQHPHLSKPVCALKPPVPGSPIKLIDAEGRSCIYLPITENGKLVDSKGYTLDPRNVE
jgi:hypothetical protein